MMSNSDGPQAVLYGPLLHFVYSNLTRDCLRLDGHDARELAALGLGEEIVTRCGYKSTPRPIYFERTGGNAERFDVAKLVIESEINRPHYFGHIFNSGEGLCFPGFYFDGDGMRLNLWKGRIIVPVKDARARIVGLQLYRSAQDTVPEWFESQRLPRGVRACRTAHFARPSLARQSRGIVITEHTVAADLHAWENDEPAVAINRLLPDVFTRALRLALPEVSFVAFAFPYPDVELLSSLHACGFEVCGQQVEESA